MDPTKTPYREGKPLDEIIPPDRRWRRTATLIVSSMIVGASIAPLGDFALERLRATRRRPPAVQGYVAGRLPPSTLRGPGEESVSLPPKVRSVVNVWMQGCQDCMPAFEAMRVLRAREGLGGDVHVINVAYGEADAEWAERYGVATNLVFDPGGAKVVRPLGIGTFASLVVDPDGSVLHRDRPELPGFRERMRAAVAVPQEESPPPVPTGTGTESGIRGPEIHRVVQSHRKELTRACWTPSAHRRPARVETSVSLTVDASGHVVHIGSSGVDPTLEKCLEHQIANWVFPTAVGETRVSLPLVFEAE